MVLHQTANTLLWSSQDTVPAVLGLVSHPHVCICMYVLTCVYVYKTQAVTFCEIKSWTRKGLAGRNFCFND